MWKKAERASAENWEFTHTKIWKFRKIFVSLHRHCVSWDRMKSDIGYIWWISVVTSKGDGGRTIAFGMQVLIANYFVLLWWKQMSSEQQLKAFRKVGKVCVKEMNASEPLMKHR